MGESEQAPRGPDGRGWPKEWVRPESPPSKDQREKAWNRVSPRPLEIVSSSSLVFLAGGNSSDIYLPGVAFVFLAFGHSVSVGANDASAQSVPKTTLGGFLP